jgi:hypothetical protein
MIYHKNSFLPLPANNRAGMRSEFQTTISQERREFYYNKLHIRVPHVNYSKLVCTSSRSHVNVLIKKLLMTQISTEKYHKQTQTDGWHIFIDAVHSTTNSNVQKSAWVEVSWLCYFNLNFMQTDHLRTCELYSSVITRERFEINIDKWSFTYEENVCKVVLKIICSNILQTIIENRGFSHIFMSL